LSAFGPQNIAATRESDDMMRPLGSALPAGQKLEPRIGRLLSMTGAGRRRAFPTSKPMHRWTFWGAEVGLV